MLCPHLLQTGWQKVNMGTFENLYSKTNQKIKQKENKKKEGKLVKKQSSDTKCHTKGMI